MSSLSEIIERQLREAGSPEQAAILTRFFKTGAGQYGEGDKFLGVRVPVTRSIVKKYRKVAVIDDVRPLIASEWHEVRLGGFLLLVEIYMRAVKSRDESMQRFANDYYLSEIGAGNNWDLVDVIAPKIFGHRLVGHPEDRVLLDQLAEMEGHLWHQRVSIVATFALICAGEYADTLRIARKLLRHEHDLIHKAVGWMLREVGKRGGEREHIEFLDQYCTVMPRTMLRYAIERLPEEQRQGYLRR